MHTHAHTRARLEARSEVRKDSNAAEDRSSPSRIAYKRLDSRRRTRTAREACLSRRRHLASFNVRRWARRETSRASRDAGDRPRPRHSCRMIRTRRETDRLRRCVMNRVKDSARTRARVERLEGNPTAARVRWISLSARESPPDPTRDLAGARQTKPCAPAAVSFAQPGLIPTPVSPPP